MSYSSESTLRSGTRAEDVLEILRLLGYQPAGVLHSEEVGPIRCYWWFDEADYRSWSGVELSVHHRDGAVVVETRTPIARSYFDLVHQNETIRLLRRHFGGHFLTDEGRGRYLQPDSDPPTPAASGCHLAFQRFGTNLTSCRVYLHARNFGTPKRHKPTGVYVMDSMDPWLISTNLLLPYLVAVAEDYWKSTFVALLRYSDRKAAVLKASRLTHDSLAAISEGRRSVEEAVAEALPFQRVSAVCRHFVALDPKLDFAAVLRGPYRRRKESLFVSLEQMTELRHEVVHRAQLVATVTEEFTAALLHNIEAAVERCYRHLTKTRGWVYDRWWSSTLRRRPNKRLQPPATSGGG